MIKVNTEHLKQSLSRSHAYASSGQDEYCRYVKLGLDKERDLLILTRNQGNVYTTATIPVVSSQGHALDVCVESEAFAKMAQSLSGEETSITKPNGKIAITSGSTHVRFPTKDIAIPIPGYPTDSAEVLAITSVRILKKVARWDSESVFPVISIVPHPSEEKTIFLSAVSSSMLRWTIPSTMDTGPFSLPAHLCAGWQPDSMYIYARSKTTHLVCDEPPTFETTLPRTEDAVLKQHMAISEKIFPVVDDQSTSMRKADFIETLKILSPAIQPESIVMLSFDGENSRASLLFPAYPMQVEHDFIAEGPKHVFHLHAKRLNELSSLLMDDTVVFQPGTNPRGKIPVLITGRENKSLECLIGQMSPNTG